MFPYGWIPMTNTAKRSKCLLCILNGRGPVILILLFACFMLFLGFFALFSVFCFLVLLTRLFFPPHLSCICLISPAPLPEFLPGLPFPPHLHCISFISLPSSPCFCSLSAPPLFLFFFSPHRLFSLVCIYLLRFRDHAVVMLLSPRPSCCCCCVSLILSCLPVPALGP